MIHLLFDKELFRFGSEGISHNSLRMSLETLLMQPGVNVQNVVVSTNRSNVL